MDKFLTKRKISRKFILKAFTEGLKDCGSYIYFLGNVRKDKKKNKEVVEIFYDAYDEMAEKTLEEIYNETKKKFNIKKIYIKHRKGKVKTGEISVFVGVISEHREEGFKAIQWIIEQIKKRVPLWKKEVFSDKTHNWK